MKKVALFINTEKGVVMSEILTTVGCLVESRLVEVREATTVEKGRLGERVSHVVDKCPGCSEVIPVIKNKIGSSIRIIALHEKKTPQGVAKCAYGGEVLHDERPCRFCCRPIEIEKKPNPNDATSKYHHVFKEHPTWPSGNIRCRGSNQLIE